MIGTIKKSIDENLIYTVAGSLWPKMASAKGLDLYCKDSKTIRFFKWKKYDPEFHPTPPPLNERFRRIVCNNYLHTLKTKEEKIGLLNLIYFFMDSPAEALITFDHDVFKTDDALELCRSRRFLEARRINLGVIHLFKV